MKNMESVLNNLVVGNAQVFGDLTFYPILGTSNSPTDLVGLEEAIESGAVEVTEVSEHGHVPELKVSNRSEKKVIIFDGEELIGAKQNRIVNVTIIIAAFSTVLIPVSCVEQGRWNWRSRHFSAGSFVSPSLRRDKFQRVTENVRRARSFSGDQGMIWNEIAAKSARMGVRSDTGAFQDLADRYRVSDEELHKKFPVETAQVGYLAFIRGGFAGADVFATPALLRRRLSKLIRSYHLDSLDSAIQFAESEPERVVEEVSRSSGQSFDSIGEGQEVRFEAETTQGSVTFLGELLAHMTIFPKVDSRSPGHRRPPYQMF